MPNHLDIDPALIDAAMELSGEPTRMAAVNRALREFVARHGQKRILALFGQLEWDADFDYKPARGRN